MCASLLPRPTSAWFAAILVLCGYAQPGLTAYVQWKDCLDNVRLGDSNSSHIRLSLESLTANVHILDQHTTLGLRVSGRLSDHHNGCETAGVLSELDILSVGGRTTHHAFANSISCPWQGWEAKEEGPHVTYDFTYGVDRLRPLQSNELTMHLQDVEGESFACLRAPLTPFIGVDLSAIAQWVPVTTLVLVIAVALLKSRLGMPSTAIDQMGPLFREADRSHLTQIADCLSYIQFIFFSGGLSLSYPLFFQAVTSHSSWATLMLSTGVVSQHSNYTGVNDGIYEVNGTFGGTFGLELMTQIIGAPTTAQSWGNIMSLVGLTFAFLVAIIQTGKRLQLTIDWFAPPLSLANRHAETLKGLRHTLWSAVRVLLSYFLMPIVAWTTYQLGHAALLPYSHTTICLVILLLLLVSYGWAAILTTPRDLGYLILDNTKTYQTLTSMSRSQNTLGVAMFGFLFARGAAIGGLQIAGMPQLTYLLGCDIILLALLVLVRPPSALFSTNGITILARLIVMVLSTSFLEGVTTTIMIKSIVGYIVLGIHAAVLVFAFLFPSLLRLGRLGTTFLRHSGEIAERDEPQIYGLRRLRQRPNTTSNFLIPTLPDLASEVQCTRPLRHAYSPRSSLRPNSPGNAVSVDTSRYFRKPRSRMPLADSLQSQSSISPIILEGVGSSLAEEASSASWESSGTEADTAIQIAQIGQFVSAGVDYSVREVDSYYKPVQLQDNAARATTVSPSRPTVTRSVSSWWKEWTVWSAKGEERGFTVFRSPRTMPILDSRSSQSLS